MTILQAVEVRKFYGTFCALDGVSLVIGEGEHVSIIGPNGAGKTTLVNVLTGLLPPSAGTVTFKGHDIGRLGPLRLLRLGMARSFQLVNIFPQLSVRETIAIAAISSLGMGGRAFALSPEIILLDEPTSGVSTAEKTTIMQVLARAAKETGIKAIIQVEHDMDIVFGYSSRIIAVHNGKILADGSPAMIRARDDVMAIVVGRP